MTENRRDWDLELEESAQGSDSFTAPGAALQLEEARESATEWAAGDADATAVARPSASEDWVDSVAESLVELRRALEEHIEVTEGPGGLLEEIGEIAPQALK